ncbi:hypothetical protein, partial [Nocardiopsis sp. NRRL B-16309]|uniref:hypothetical protein n=1 Tax=Nocardiopsis sp. NRRL B-16309 TaxID=1519494 RepID=UPI0018D033AE
MLSRSRVGLLGPGGLAGLGPLWTVGRERLWGSWGDGGLAAGGRRAGELVSRARGPLRPGGLTRLAVVSGRSERLPRCAGLRSRGSLLSVGRVGLLRAQRCLVAGLSRGRGRLLWSGGDGGLAAGRDRAGELLSRCTVGLLWSGGDGGLAAGRGRAGELLSGCARLGSVRAL